MWNDDKKVKHATIAADLFNDRVAGIKLKCFEELAVSWLASGGRDTPPIPMFLRQDGENKKIPSSSDEEEDNTASFLHQFPSPHEHSH